MYEQFSLFDKKPLDIRGLCDDGFCPVCGYAFDDINGELDLERCPRCNTAVDWSMWHKLNDKYSLVRIQNNVLTTRVVAKVKRYGADETKRTLRSMEKE